MSWKALPGDGDRSRSVKSSIDQLVSRYGLPKSDTLSTVFTRWEDVVGKEVTEHVQPHTLIGKVLTVVAEDTTWATQLKWLSGSIIQRVNEIAGADVVDRVEIRVGPGPASPRNNPLNW